MLPPRFTSPGKFRIFAIILAFALISVSMRSAEISITSFVEGIPFMWSVLSEMFPPQLDRLPNIGTLLLSTFSMAVAGTVLGLIASFPLAVFAARTTTPNRIVYSLARGAVSLARTIPDLVWALFFVVTVGIGSFAGVLTIAVDTIGFCARFFAESMEELDHHPEEALNALGADKLSIIATYIFPTCLPSFINTILFSLEKAVRSSVVLGLVGAGGVGVELKVAMDTFRYDEACTIILAIFALVIVVEQVSSRVRKSLLEQSVSN